MKYNLPFLIAILFMLSCYNIQTKDDAKTPIDIAEDEVAKIIPIRIVNDSATIKILHYNLYGENNFEIELLEKDKTSVFDVAKYSIEDSVRLSEIFDSLEVDNIADIFIEEVNYKFIRANSLYFHSVFKNKKNENLIDVGFSIFYRDTKRNKSGDIYGWYFMDKKRSRVLWN